MSTSAARFQGISAARAKLAKLAAALRDHTGVLARAAAQVSDQVQAVSAAKLAKHVDTGAAAGSASVSVSGGLVLLSTNRYLDFHGWWPFRRGMPPFVVARAAEILAREFLATIGAEAGGELGTMAAELVEGADARERKKIDKLAAADRARAKRKADAVQARKDRAHTRWQKKHGIE